MAEQNGKTGITIDCKSLDKRPGIVKTRNSILILYVASQGWAGERSDKGQKSTRVAVFNSGDDCRHLFGHKEALFISIIEMLQNLFTRFYESFVKKRNFESHF